MPQRAYQDGGDWGESACLVQNMVTYIRSLDKLRGIAVLLVLFTHTPSELKGSVALWFQAYANPGYMGVDLFFALSGFLITRILLSDKERGGKMASFWIRRALRIFPACYLCLAVVWILRPGPEMPWVATYTSNFYFLGGTPPSPLAHTWSLAVEEHFYLVWPLLLFGLTRRNAERCILWGLLPLAIGSALLIAASYPDDAFKQGLIIGHITASRIFTLALGSLLAFHEHALTGRPGRSILAALAGAALGYTWVLSGYLQPSMQPQAGVHQLLGFGLFSTSIVLLFLILDRATLPRASALIGRPLAYVGRISYGLYLYHLPVFFFLGISGGAGGDLSWSYMMFALLLSLLIASLSYHLFERPLLRWGARFRVPVPAAATSSRSGL